MTITIVTSESIDLENETYVADVLGAVAFLDDIPLVENDTVVPPPSPLGLPGGDSDDSDDSDWTGQNAITGDSDDSDANDSNSSVPSSQPLGPPSPLSPQDGRTLEDFTISNATTDENKTTTITVVSIFSSYAEAEDYKTKAEQKFGMWLEGGFNSTYGWPDAVIISLYADAPEVETVDETDLGPPSDSGDFLDDVMDMLDPSTVVGITIMAVPGFCLLACCLAGYRYMYPPPISAEKQLAMQNKFMEDSGDEDEATETAIVLHHDEDKEKDAAKDNQLTTGDKRFGSFFQRGPR
ncbi:hypothetical protein CYMTET_15886 [Cymbomonas tetramitiformis]|uniref:Uncharacterized protein n=1 Tax=Cymbomonas tetramitiformis TaxID=36881 RepID=A0AAE0GD71_9CHLO|nr:hypothetical protein CYMTET_15886 [Cymbomonas tetramitiformis]